MQIGETMKKKRITIDIPLEVHTRLKMLAASFADCIKQKTND